MAKLSPSKLPSERPFFASIKKSLFTEKPKLKIKTELTPFEELEALAERDTKEELHEEIED